MHHELRAYADADEVAAAAADYVAARATQLVAANGRFSLAVSGGHTPEAMFAQLGARAAPWEGTVIYQVDERVVPMDDTRRNLTQLRRGLAGLAVAIEAMPVDDLDLDAAARHYGELLPAALDLVHLGLGADAHTASLVPGDRVLAVTDRPVTVTDLYQGTRRMTLTYPALARADQLLWLVTGEDKRDALSRLLAGDTEIPAGRVEARHSLVLADRAAL